MSRNTENRGHSVPPPATAVIRGARLHAGWLDQAAQAQILKDVRAIARAAPLFSPVTAWGRPMSVRMTSAGDFGWYSDRRGYRYIGHHPEGGPWPPIPPSVLRVWSALSAATRPPECCLVNWYGPDARMGLHQDRDEADMTQPVLSISLGDDGLFRIGGARREDGTESVWLRSGDVLVLEGPSRLHFHGIDRIAAGTSTLLAEPGRVNLTLRVVTPRPSA